MLVIEKYITKGKRERKRANESREQDVEQMHWRAKEEGNQKYHPCRSQRRSVQEEGVNYSVNMLQREGKDVTDFQKDPELEQIWDSGWVWLLNPIHKKLSKWWSNKGNKINISLMVKEKRLRVEQEYFRPWETQLICRQTTRNQLKDEIKKNTHTQEKVVKMRAKGRVRYTWELGGMGWRGGGRENETNHTQELWAILGYAPPWERQDRTLSGNSEKMSKLIQKSSLHPTHLLLSGGEKKRSAGIWTNLDCLTPTTGSKGLQWSPVIKSALKTCY